MDDTWETQSDPFRPITMQDVRLRAGEGKLTARDVLAACNAELAARARQSPVRCCDVPGLCDTGG